MKIKFFIGFLSFFSMCLIQESQAGSYFSTDKQEEKRTVTPTNRSQNQPPQQESQNAIVPYNYFKYAYDIKNPEAVLEIPYPTNAKLSLNEAGSTFSNEIYQIWIMSEEMKKKNITVQELAENKNLNPESMQSVKDYFLKIQQDMNFIGGKTQKFNTCAQDSIKTVEKHVEGLKFDKIWQSARIRRNRESLESHLFFKMEENTYIMFHVLPLPKDLWRKI